MWIEKEILRSIFGLLQKLEVWKVIVTFKYRQSRRHLRSHKLKHMPD